MSAFKEFLVALQSLADTASVSDDFMPVGWKSRQIELCTKEAEDAFARAVAAALTHPTTPRGSDE